jgi:hypothetical protein
MMNWIESMQFNSNIDGIFRAIVVLIAVYIFIAYSTVFEVEYSTKLLDLYTKPWWRMLIVFLLISSAIWCPRVGIVIAALLFFYLGDMETLTTPFLP